jgi:hypothetical protein
MKARAFFAFAASLLAPFGAFAGTETEEVFAAIISIKPGDGEYSGYYCAPFQDENDICLGASILIQRGSVDRYIGNLPDRRDPRLKSARRSDVDGAYFRIKMIGGHAMRRIRPGRYLAIVEPTNDGYFFAQWYESYSETKGCFPEEVVDHYNKRLSFDRLKLREDGSRCL